MGAFSRAFKRIFKGGEGKFAVIVIAFWLVLAAISLFWTPWPLNYTDGFNTWAAPTGSHILGTDGAGQDVFSWLMAGSLTELELVVAVVVVTGVLGILLIALSLVRSRIGSSIVVVAIDALLSVPLVLIALILAVPLGASLWVVIIACSVAYGLALARLAQPAVRVAAESDYVQAALFFGASRPRVFFRHILPNILPVLCVQLSLSAGTAILAESGLTYLGIGVPVGTPSWGFSLATSASFIQVYPLSVLWPGLLITLSVVALNLLGDRLRVAFSPTDVQADTLNDVQLGAQVGAQAEVSA
jgi:peptide/nickel transport system permease protein